MPLFEGAPRTNAAHEAVRERQRRLAEALEAVRLRLHVVQTEIARDGADIGAHGAHVDWIGGVLQRFLRVFRFLPDEAFNPGVRHDVIRAFTVAAAGTLTLADRIGDRLSEIKLAEAARAAALASSLPTVKVGIIGGTGLEDPQILENARLIDNVDTPYGKISDKMLEGSIHGVECVILSRDGRAHDINPSNINYRANLWALADQGVTVIIASTACGSLQENVKPGDLLFPDSVYDRTFGRKITFFDGEDGYQPGVCHIPMHPLYHEPLRQILISTAKSLQSSMPDLALHEDGFGVCIEGPRFLTRAESRVFRSWGAAIVNMTMIPEGPLAKELGIPYAPVALITDYDCWKDDAEHVSVEVVSATLRATADKAKRLFIEAIKEIAKKDWTEEVKELKASIRASVMLPSEVKIKYLDAGDH